MNDTFEFDLFDDGDSPSSVATATAAANAPVAEPRDIAAAVAETKAAPRRKAKATRDSILYFDLETVPDWDRLPQFGIELPTPAVVENLLPPEEFISQGVKEIDEWLDSFDPPADWLQQVYAAEKAAKKPRKGALDAIDKAGNRKASLRKTLSTTPEFCRVCAIGWATDGREPSADVIDGPDSERQALADLWAHFAHARTVVGFNVLHFDLPVVFTRSILLNVAPTRAFDLRPWGTDVCDLFKRRWPQSNGMKLKTVAASLGIQVPAGDCDGSQVEELLTAGEVGKLSEYVKSDVHITRELHRLWSGTFCE